jgi:hypothetical protein
MKLSLLLSLVAFTVPPMLHAESALERGQAFLKENATKEGVKTTPSGLQYKITKEGTGRSPRRPIRSSSITGAQRSMGKSSIARTSGMLPPSSRSIE